MIILDPEKVWRNRIFFSKDLYGGLQIGVFSEKYTKYLQKCCRQIGVNC